MTMKVIITNSATSPYVAMVKKQIPGDQPDLWVSSAEDPVQLAPGTNREFYIHHQLRLVVEES